MNCPRLIPGTDYGPSRDWPVVLRKGVTAQLDYDLGYLCRFYSAPQLLAHHEHGRLRIHKGYACDGYSPTLRVCGKFLSLTPTPKAGLFPAILHDITRQFIGVTGCPWDRQDSDEWFFDALVAGGVSPHIAGTYYGAVAGPVGSAFIKLTRKVDHRLWIEKIEYP